MVLREPFDQMPLKFNHRLCDFTKVLQREENRFPGSLEELVRCEALARGPADKGFS